MLLVIDIGNTNTVLGVFDGNRLAADWRLETKQRQTADEYGILARNLFALAEMEVSKIQHIVIASVVPPLNSVLEQMALKYFKLKPLFVEPGVKTGMPVLYDSPADVGADRIVNAVAAFERYGGPVIVVDFGTATTFDAISAKGEYLGGVITPGPGISAEALFARTARLPRVEIKAPGEGHWHFHRGEHSVGPLLRLHRNDRWHSGTNASRTRYEDKDHRHRRLRHVDWHRVGPHSTD